MLALLSEGRVTLRCERGRQKSSEEEGQQKRRSINVKPLSPPPLHPSRTRGCIIDARLRVIVLSCFATSHHPNMCILLMPTPSYSPGHCPGIQLARREPRNLPTLRRLVKQKESEPAWQKGRERGGTGVQVFSSPDVAVAATHTCG